LIVVVACVVAASTLMLVAAGASFAAGGKTAVTQKAPAGKIGKTQRLLGENDGAPVRDPGLVETAHFGW
jgi:hypothetical protein